MLATRPRFTGSPAAVATIGIVVVASLAARVTFSLPTVTMTETFRRTRSSASEGKSSYFLRAQRASIATLWPSINPVSARPTFTAVSLGANPSGVPSARNPTIGSAGCCCARAARGHVMAEPETTLMKSRRRIAAPGLRSTPIPADYIRDLLPAKWGSGVGSRGSNPEPPMSALGQ